VSYVECHATGTPLGDAVEVGALEGFFAKHSARPRVGSVKANVGHLLTVAGLSSLRNLRRCDRSRSFHCDCSPFH
jgi:acyl transferase domain-containing protein